MTVRGDGRPPRGRYVTSSGERVPSVSSILDRYKDSGGLIAWAMREGYRAERIRDEAASIGSVVHDAIQDAVHGVDPPSHWWATQRPEVVASMGAWIDWWQGGPSSWDWLETEVARVSERYRFGGTCDAIARDDEGDLLVVDWKTSKRIYMDHVYQCAAYAQLYGEATGEMPTGYVIVQIPKTGEPARVKSGGAAVLQAARRQFLRLRKALEEDSELSAMLGFRK